MGNQYPQPPHQILWQVHLVETPCIRCIIRAAGDSQNCFQLLGFGTRRHQDGVGMTLNANHSYPVQLPWEHMGSPGSHRCICTVP